MSAPTPQPQPQDAKLTDLNDGEVEWVRINLDWLTESGWDGSPERLQELHDQLMTAWRSAPEIERPDPNDLVNAIGIGLGDILARRLGLRWQVYTDAQGSDLSVHAEQGAVTLFPVATVARFFEEGGTGWVVDWVEQVGQRVAEVRAGAD